MEQAPDTRSTGEHALLVLPGRGAGRSARAVQTHLAPAPAPATEWARSRYGTGLEHPDDLPPEAPHPTLERTFCFVDLSGFTQYTREHGPHEAVRLLEEFRAVTRSNAAQRGVRVAKWLGDGAMLVSTEAGPAVALGAHLVTHFAHTEIAIRVGLASGEALLFEGDDYIGEPVNLAAKLCAAAEPREILADVDVDDLPDWVEVAGDVELEIRNMGRIGGILRLRPPH